MSDKADFFSLTDGDRVLEQVAIPESATEWLLFEPKLEAMDMVDGDGDMEPDWESFEAVDVALFDERDGGGLRIVRLFESRLTVRKGTALFKAIPVILCGLACSDSILAVTLLSVLSKRGRLEGRGIFPFVSIPPLFSWMLIGLAMLTDGGLNFDLNCAMSLLPTSLCCVAGALLLLLLDPSLRTKRHLVGTGYFSIAACRTIVKKKRKREKKCWVKCQHTGNFVEYRVTHTHTVALARLRHFSSYVRIPIEDDDWILTKLEQNYSLSAVNDVDDRGKLPK